MKKTTKLLLALLVMGAVAAKAQAPQEDMDDKYATSLVKVGTAAPDFKMKTPQGETIQLSEFAKGKTVVLDFWASWCPDCRKDAPEVVRLYNKYHQYGIEFIGVSMDTDVEAWKKAIEKFGITYPQVSELKKFKETDIAKAYGVNWIPSMVVVGPDGQVKLSTVLTNKVDKYLNELVTITGHGQAEKQYNISGSVPEGIEKVYLYKAEGLGNRIFLDSATVANGSFTMKGNLPAYELVSLGNKGLHGITFFADGEPIKVDFVNDTLTVSALNKKFLHYMAEGEVFTDNFYRLYKASKKAGSEAEKREIEQQIAANSEASNEQSRRIIRENRDNVIAAYYLQSVCDFMDYEELSAAIDSTAYYFNHPLMNEAKLRLHVLQLRKIGSPIADATLSAPNGQSHQLSEWCGQGKYVLIDFWASWCRPCRMEMPNVIKNYERFRDLGFEVLAVSIDDKKSAWLRGIKDFGTPFVQLSELKGRRSELAAIYGITTIPANLLIDPQGKIIAADLRGNSLTRKLESIFKK